MVRARADGCPRRRQAKNNRRPARRPRAEIGTQRRTRDLRLRAGDLKTRRVSDRTYRRVHDFVGDAAMVELVGILGYYTLISMTLNVFRMLPPDDASLAFGGPN